MPIVAPMKTLSGPEFLAWYTKNRTKSGLAGAAYMALAKEDKEKARRFLKYDMDEEKRTREKAEEKASMPPPGPAGTKYHIGKIKELAKEAIEAAKKGDLFNSYIHEMLMHRHDIQEIDKAKVEKLVDTLRHKIENTKRAY